MLVYRQEILARLPTFVQDYVLQSSSNNNTSSATENNSSDTTATTGRLFLDTLQQSVAKLQQLLQTAEEGPRLLKDFQFVLTPTGHILHLDLDRIQHGFHCARGMVMNRIQLLVDEVTAIIQNATQ